MTKPATKESEADLESLRKDVELLELRVRKLQALEWLRNHKVNRVAAAKK